MATAKKKTNSKQTKKKQPRRQKHLYAYVAVGVLVLLIAGFFFSPLPETITGNAIKTETGPVIATVNNEPIHEKDVLQTKTFMEAQTTQEITNEDALDGAINAVLVVQEAATLEIHFSTEHAETQLGAALQQEEGMSLEDFKTQVTAQGHNYNDIIEGYRKQLLLEAVVSQQIEHVTITDEETLAFYEENRDQLFGGSVTPPYEAIKDQLTLFLTQQELQRQIVGYVAQLRDNADIVIL